MVLRFIDEIRLVADWQRRFAADVRDKPLSLHLLLKLCEEQEEEAGSTAELSRLKRFITAQCVFAQKTKNLLDT